MEIYNSFQTSVKKALDEIDVNWPTYRGLIICGTHSPHDTEKMISRIKEARESGEPALLICAGHQLGAIEYARNVLGYSNASHAEYDPSSDNLFITSLACSLRGKEMQLIFEENSKIAKIYGKTTSVENYYCNFGMNPEFVPLFQISDLKPTGADSEGKMRVVELVNHPFFIGTLFVPQIRSTIESPHPVVTAFFKTII